MKGTSADAGNAVGAEWAQSNGTQEPSASNGNGAGPATAECSCGETVTPTPRGQCPRCGRVLPGNALALRHGGRAELALVDPERSELFKAWAADLGGESELTTGDRAVLRRVAEADAVCRTAYSYLENSRESLASRRVEKALAVLASHAQVVFRGAAMLGLERRARSVDVARQLSGLEGR